MFAAEVKAIPAVPFMLEPSSHYAVLQERVVAAANRAYPFVAGRRKKEWLSGIPINGILERGVVLRKLRSATRWLGDLPLLEAVFGFWARSRRIRFSFVRGFMRRNVARKYFSLVARLGYLNRRVHMYVELDKTQHLESTAVCIDKILVEGLDMHKVHSHLRDLKHRSSRPKRKATRIIDPSSSLPVRSALCEKRIVREHFSLQLGGTQTTLGDLHKSSLDALANC